MQKLFSLINSNPDIYTPWINRRVIPDWIDQEIITERISDRVFPTPQENSNIDRYTYLQKNPTAWYLDADVIVQKWPDFEMEKGLPYLACVCRMYNNWAILANGCAWFFDYLLDLYEQRKNNHKRLWVQPLLNRELKDKIRPIPDGYFIHLSLSMKLRKNHG